MGGEEGQMDVPAAKNPAPRLYRSALLGNSSCSHRLWCLINKTWAGREGEALLWEGGVLRGKYFDFQSDCRVREEKILGLKLQFRLDSFQIPAEPFTLGPQ